jgi:PrtD family type I secretion system ABC transporter
MESIMSDDKNRDFASTMSALPAQAPALLLFSFLANLLLLASAVYMLQVYARVLSSGSLDTLVWLTIVTVAAIVAYGVLEHARRSLLGRLAAWVEDDLSRPVLRAAMAARLAGSNVEANLKDVSDIRGFLAGESIIAFLDAPWSPVFLLLIWWIHPALGALAIVGAIALFACALANDIFTRRYQQANSAMLRANQTAAQHYVEGAETISPLGMTEAVLARWQERQHAIATARQRLAERTATFVNVSRALRLALQVLILGIGAYYVLQGQLSGGAMIAGSIILSRALAPVERSISAWRSLVAARSARENLRRTMNEDRRTATPVSLPRPMGHLQVQTAHYFMPASREPILKGVSFELQPGEACAIVGPSGAGKSSLCRLLVGAWKPMHGHVRLDDADVAAWDAEDFGRYLGYLPQQVELFPGTVASNIARLRDADSAAIIAAAQLAGVHEMVLRLPDGYETDVGVHGARISIGQRQRIGLARALFGDPAFIVLDEPTANLDNEGDQALMQAIAQLRDQRRTVVIVTHQASVLHSIDKILVLRDGSVAAFGPRDDILKALRAPRQVAAASAAQLAQTTRPTLVSGS